jgi:hypothetical protein
MSPIPASFMSEHLLLSMPASSAMHCPPLPTSPPHEIPLPPQERPPIPPTRYIQTSSTPFPNSTGKEKKAGKTSTSSKILKAFSSSSESFSSLLEANMKARRDHFKASMEHYQAFFQF